MFGLSIEKALSKGILNSSKQHIGQYKQDIMSIFSSHKDIQQDGVQTLLQDARIKYLESVTNSVTEVISLKSQQNAFRLLLALSSPSLCGYEEIDIDKGLLAGSLYAICYYAVKDKIAAPEDCVRLNHLQNDIMNQALHEVAQQLDRSV